MRDWGCVIMVTEDHDQTYKIAMIMWAIWLFPDKKVRKKGVSPLHSRLGYEAGSWLEKVVSQVQNFRPMHTSDSNRENVKWVRLERGSFKVNVDASIVEGSTCFIIRMLLKDHTGFLVEGRTIKFNRAVLVMEAETSFGNGSKDNWHQKSFVMDCFKRHFKRLHWVWFPVDSSSDQWYYSILLGGWSYY